MQELTKDRIDEICNDTTQQPFDTAKIAEINIAFRMLQRKYAPTAGELTNERVVWEAVTRYCRVDQVNAITAYVFSRRTAPQPAAEPSPAPFGCGGDLMSMAEAKEIASHAPVPAPSGDVIGEMLDAAEMAVGYYSRECMTAAYAVARAHMLAHPPAGKRIEGMMHCEKHGVYWDEEFGEVCALCAKTPPAGWVLVDAVEKHIAELLDTFERCASLLVGKDYGFGYRDAFRHLRARLKPAEKTPERVTVSDNGTEWEVRSPKQTTCFLKVMYSKQDADTFAAGLRAELKGAGE